MTRPEHVVDVIRHERHWIARCTCGTTTASLRISDALDRIYHQKHQRRAAG